MAHPAGVQLATLTFSNPITFLGNEADRTELSVQPTIPGGVVWAATGQPIDDFAEVVSPGPGLPGQIVVPYVDQPGFTDQAGNAVTGWAYKLSRRTVFGASQKVVSKAWAPVLGQGVMDFDNLPGGTVGLPATIAPVPVTSVAGLTLEVTAPDLAVELTPYLPEGVTPEALASAVAPKLDASQKGAVSGVAPLDASQKLPDPNLPDRLQDTALAAKIATETAAPIAAAVAPKLDSTAAATTYVKFVDLAGNPISARHVTIKVDTSTWEIADIVAEA